MALWNIFKGHISFGSKIGFTHRNPIGVGIVPRRTLENDLSDLGDQEKLLEGMYKDVALERTVGKIQFKETDSLQEQLDKVRQIIRNLEQLYQEYVRANRPTLSIRDYGKQKAEKEATIQEINRMQERIEQALEVAFKILSEFNNIVEKIAQHSAAQQRNLRDLRNQHARMVKHLNHLKSDLLEEIKSRKSAQQQVKEKLASVKI